MTESHKVVCLQKFVGGQNYAKFGSIVGPQNFNNFAAVGRLVSENEDLEDKNNQP